MKYKILVWRSFLQALGVLAYCGLVASLMQFLSGLFKTLPGLLGNVFMLILLVFSVAITGSLVFGYPVYLVLNKGFSKGLVALSLNLGFCFLIIVLIFGFLFFWR